MSFSSYLTNKTSDDGFPLLESTTLDEAVNSFAELPAKWKKLVAGSQGGENSAVDVFSSNTFKTMPALQKGISTVIKDLVAEEGYGLIEINGEPLALVTMTNANGKNEYKIVAQDGKALSVTAHRRGSRGMNHYYDTPYLTTSDAKTELSKLVMDYIETIREEGEEDKDLLKRVDFTAKSVKLDANRAEIKASRKSTGRGGADGSREGLTTAKRAVLKKYTSEVITKIMDDIRKSLPKLADPSEVLDRVIAGESVDISIDNSVIDKIRDLNALLRRFSNAYREGKTVDVFYGGNGISYGKKGALSYYTKAVAEIARKYKSELEDE